MKYFHMKKYARKVLMKSTQGVDFANILWAAFFAYLFLLAKKLQAQTVSTEKLLKYE